MNNKMKILILPGDGVGPEITLEAKKVINKISSIFNLNIEIEEALFGGVAVDKLDSPYPEETKIKVKESDAVLLGAVGGIKYDVLPKEKKPESGLLSLRKESNLFINIRPIISFSELANSSSVKSEYINNLDIVIIRELISGLYFGEPRGFNDDKTEAYNTMRYSKSEISRISNYAFKLARSRNKKLCSVDKANVLEVSQLWRSTTNEASKNYKDVELSHLYVDNAAMQLVQNPKQFDVMVTENLFGDILSDIASVLTGSIGMLPSASLNEFNFGVYEPIHGSAPDIAGMNIVNPIATILSVAMMFQHTFQRVDIYNSILNAVKLVLRENKFTKDLTTGDNYISTEEMGNLIVEKLIGETE
jgi:3-isopropylmalate dehydrogenase